MTDREKAINGLECCLPMTTRTGLGDCGNCPYDRRITLEGGILECFHELMLDVLAMLKAQEPRVMTLEEVKAFEWDYCYLEQERQPGKEYRMIVGDYALTCITWPCITSMRIEYGDSSYGVKWRCWTSRPTDEQRKAVKWK